MMAYVDQGSNTSGSSGDERHMDQLLLRASDWSLACDNALLNKLQELSDNLVRSSEKIVNDCDELMSDVDNLQFKVTNVTNEFLLLANTHFVENAVEEFKEFDVDPKQPPKPVQAPTKAEKEALLIDKMKEAIQVGVRTQQEREIQRLKRSEEFCHGSGESSHGLNLGHIIGSSKFFSSKYCGLHGDRKYQIAKNTNSCISSETSNSTNSGFDESLPPSNQNVLTFPDFSDGKAIEDASSSKYSPIVPTLSAYAGYDAEASLFTTPKPASLAPASDGTPELTSDNVVEKASSQPQFNIKTPVPAPFSYIPIPARPPSTPSLSSADSSPVDLAPHLSHGFPPSDDIFPEVVSPTTPTKIFPQPVKTKEAEDSIAEAHMRSPPPKPVHKFLDAAVISQLEKRLQAPKASIPAKENVDRNLEASAAVQVPVSPSVPIVHVKQTEQSPPPKTDKILQPTQSPPKSLKSPSEFPPKVIPQSLPSPLFKTPVIEVEFPQTTVTNPTSTQKSVGVERLQPPPVTVVKKSIFDSDSDDDDDLLFSSKPMKSSVALPKTSIFASLDSFKANDDLFRPPPILDMSDSEDESDIFKVTKSVEISGSSNDRNIFSDLSVEVEAKEVSRKVANASSANDMSVSAVPNESPNEANQSVPAPSEGSAARMPTNELFPEASLVDQLSESTLAPEEEIADDLSVVTENAVKINPESGPATDNLFKEEFVAPPPVEDHERQFTRRQQLSSEDSADIFEDIVESIPQKLPQEVLTAPSFVSPAFAPIDTHVEQVRATVTPPPIFGEIAESTGSSIASKLYEENAEDDDDIFKDVSLVYSKTPLPSFSSTPPPQPPPVSMERSSKIKHEMIVKSIFDSSDSDDDLFATKKPAAILSSTSTPVADTLKAIPEQKDEKIPVVTDVAAPVVAPAVITELPKNDTEEIKKVIGGVSVLPAISSQKNNTALSTDTHSMPVPNISQALTNSKTTTAPNLKSPAIKAKSLFDSSDSDEGDLFSTKATFMKPSPTQTKSDSVTTKSSRPKSSESNPKRKAMLFEDSDNDSDDLFKKPKSSAPGSATAQLPVSKPSESVQDPVVVSVPRLEAADGVGKAETSETEKCVEKKPSRNNKFRAVSQNLENLFSAKLNAGKPIKPSQKQDSDPTVEDEVPKIALFDGDTDATDAIFDQSSSIENPLIATGGPGNSNIEPSFDDSPNLGSLLPCLTKSRPKFTRKRRPKVRVTSRKRSEESPQERPENSQESD